MPTALGCVLYEMLAGRKAFDGEDATDTPTSVMRDQPDWSTLPPSTPPGIRLLLRRCLEKDVRKRAPHVAVARLAIEDAMTPAGDLAAGAAIASPRARSRIITVSAGVIAVALAVAAGYWAAMPRTIERAPSLYRSTLLIDENINPRAPSQRLALSPDGRRLVYAAAENANAAVGARIRLWRRSLDGLTSQVLPGTEGAIGPFRRHSASAGRAWCGSPARVSRPRSSTSQSCIAISGCRQRHARLVRVARRTRPQRSLGAERLPRRAHTIDLHRHRAVRRVVAGWQNADFQRRGDRRPLLRKAVDGSGGEQPVPGDDQPKLPFDWSSDGRTLLYETFSQQTTNDVWALPLDGSGVPVPIAMTRFSERWPQFSPDGRWIAYASDESGVREVHVTRFGGGGRWQISAAGGSYPRWSRDGRELFFYTPNNKISAVQIKVVGDAIEAGPTTPLVDARSPAGFGRCFYDVAPDGRFLLSSPASTNTSAMVTLLVNWPSMLTGR
ncbi:MAG TPA: hypothetical protein VKE96_01445 [Vicinamibacterales bacterium]|nr:hypothetical protein [Vicinamibacterales bacterium]